MLPRRLNLLKQQRVVPNSTPPSCIRRLTIVTDTEPASEPQISLFPDDGRLVDINHRSESQMVATMIYADVHHTRVHPRVLVFRHSHALTTARDRAQDPTITVLKINRGADTLYITDPMTEVWLDGKEIRSSDGVVN